MTSLSSSGLTGCSRIGWARASAVKNDVELSRVAVSNVIDYHQTSQNLLSFGVLGTCTDSLSSGIWLREGDFGCCPNFATFSSKFAKFWLFGDLFGFSELGNSAKKMEFSVLSEFRLFPAKDAFVSFATHVSFLTVGGGCGLQSLLLLVLSGVDHCGVTHFAEHFVGVGESSVALQEWH